MKRIILITLLLISTNVNALDSNWNDSKDNYKTKITSFLLHYFSKYNPKKLKRALKVLPIVLEESEKGNVNPIIVSSIITLESTWNFAAIGKLGEIGLMQINNDPNVKPDDPNYQVKRGIEILKMGFEKCKTIEGAISFYARGKTCKSYKGTKLRINLAKEIEGY